MNQNPSENQDENEIIDDNFDDNLDETPLLNLKEMHEIALKEFTLAINYWDPIYTEALNAVEFKDGNQWKQAQVKSRKKRPTITENKVLQFVDRIVSPVREEGLKIKIQPPDMSNSDPKDQIVLKSRIDLYQGKISDIEHQSNALDAYVKGIEFSSTGGIGFIRTTLLPDEYTGTPVIKIVRDAYPYGKYLDPNIETSTGADANFGFVTEKMDRKTFQDKYGKTALKELPSTPSLSQQSWISQDTITVCEYFKIISTKQTILIMTDGTEVISSPDITEEMLNTMHIGATRYEIKKQLFHAKMNGVKFLEHTVLPLSYVPLVLVSGREIIINQKRSLVGIVHYIKDAQMKYNFYASAEVEIVALSPKATFIAAAQQIDPYKKIWQSITTQIIDVLPYDASPINGVSVPPPQRLSMLNNDFTALIAAKQAAFEDMKSNTGIYTVGLGEQTIDQSGKAILLREKSQNVNSNIYHFNLCESIKHLAKIIIEQLPMTFNPNEPIHIRSEDGKPQQVNLKENPYTLNCSDMIIETGRNYDTRRTETADQLMSLIGLLTPIVPDPKKLTEIAALLTKSLDIVDAQRISDILTGNTETQNDPTSVMEDLKKALANIDIMQKHIDEQDKKLADKQADRELEMDKAILDTKTKLAVKELDIQGSIELAQGQIAQRAIAHGGALIPELVPQQSDINTNVGPSVDQTTNQIIQDMDHQSDIGFGETQEMNQPPIDMNQIPSQNQGPMIPEQPMDNNLI